MQEQHQRTQSPSFFFHATCCITWFFDITWLLARCVINDSLHHANLMESSSSLITAETAVVMHWSVLPICSNDSFQCFRAIRDWFQLRILFSCGEESEHGRGGGEGGGGGGGGGGWFFGFLAGFFPSHRKEVHSNRVVKVLPDVSFIIWLRWINRRSSSAWVIRRHATTRTARARKTWPVLIATAFNHRQRARATSRLIYSKKHNQHFIFICIYSIISFSSVCLSLSGRFVASRTTHIRSWKCCNIPGWFSAVDFRSILLTSFHIQRDSVD